MSRPRPPLVLVLAAAALLPAACGSGSATTSTHTVTVTTTVSTPATSTSGSTSTSGGTTAASGARNMVASTALKAALLAAGAALHKLPASDFTGLTKGDTYFAYDAGTKTYWAGTQLIPSSSSQAAQVSSQDDGAYLIFRSSSSSGPWQGWATGAALHPADCPVKIPAAVLAVWNWAPGACRPRSF